MNNFKHYKYTVSVIIPVYNLSGLISICIESLLKQTIDQTKMQILLINDGSSDNSLEICQYYAQSYTNIEVYTQENSGVAETRNLGIKRSKGKYIMFLDGDDTISPETVKSVTDYFDSIYEDVDLVTYKIISYKNGVAQPLHYRYKYLKASGIYDLNAFPYCTQTTMNVVVKNQGNIFFDTTMSHGEDQKYITENLADKMKMGYCDKGEYHYIRREESAVSNGSYSFYMFEQKMKLYEDLFAKYQYVPRYIQGIVLANWYWELGRDCIFPYHYKGEQCKIAKQRIQNIVDKIDVETIMEHPQIDTFHKHFWISMKSNISPVVLFEKDNISILINGKKIYQRPKIEIILEKITVENNNLEIWGFVKSPVFNYINELPHVIVDLDGNKQETPVFLSNKSCYKTKVQTNKFWGFRFSYEANKINTLDFIVQIEGIEYCTEFYCVPTAVFNKQLNIHSYVRDGYKITLHSNRLFITKISVLEKKKLQYEQDFSGKITNTIKSIRNTAISNKSNIWIYCDSKAIGLDNAYYQFLHDWNTHDDIQRWYVYDGNKSEIEPYFTEEQRNFLLEYGSNKHKVMFLCATYVLTSFSDIHPKIPFVSENEYAFYRDLKQPKIIYLQHGILHANLRHFQSAESCKVDKIVVSSFFEKQLYVENYHYKNDDLIPVGMPRFDYIRKESKPKSRILFAPSWRSYLVERGNGNEWKGNAETLIKSDYFQKFMQFLTSNRLNDLLEENNLYLDAKLHQNMKDALEFFDLDSERVHFVEHVSVDDYKIFITDISSYVFDYAYLNRAIFYFMPDMEQFESGMNHYRQLELPFEKSFGRVVYNADDAIDEVERIISNNYIPDSCYLERMEDFYLPLNNSREKLYQYLAKNDHNKDSWE